MGTNGLVGFRHHGVRKGAYNHNDSGLGCLGQRIVLFIKSLSEEEIQLMLQRVSKLSWVGYDSTPPHDLQERYKAAGLYDGTVSSGSPEEWYCLLRGAQDGRCLELIKSGTLDHMLDASDIVNEPTCFAAYYIDFEEKVLEVVSATSGDAKHVKEFTFQELDNRSMDRLDIEIWGE